MRLNKYNELYQNFLHTLTELHNAHLAYQRRPGRTTLKEIRKQLNSIRDQIPVIRDEVIEIQREINVEKSTRFRELQKLKKEGNKDE